MRTVADAYAVLARSLEERGASVSGLSPDSRLSALGLDSLGFVEVVFELEVHFDVEINEELLLEVETVGQVIALLNLAEDSSDAGVHSTSVVSSDGRF